MPDLFLYSTNNRFKLMIGERFRSDRHYAWCSETFDATTVGRYSTSALLPSSSNPADIYRQLLKDVLTSDRHSTKIAEQKLIFRKLADDWSATGDISDDDRVEIKYMVDQSSFDEWRPLLYIISRPLVTPRMKLVPPASRAGLAPEYVVDDLERSEFDIVEWQP